MQNGKIPGNILKRSVINLIGRGPKIGVDCAQMSYGGSYVLSAAAVGDFLMPEFAVYKAANNIWASGGELLGIEAVFLLDGELEEPKLKTLTRRVIAACDRCGTYLAGGHTEVSGNVVRSCVTVTAIGSAADVMNVRNIRPGEDIVLTKWLGLEETAIVLSDAGLCKKLSERFAPQYFEQVADCREWLTVKDEAKLAAEFGVTAMHDVSDGGIYGALWEFSEGACRGFEVDLGLMPFRQETVEISTFFGTDAYRMKSAGSLLAACADGDKLVKKLEDADIPACVIGRFTDNNAKIVRNGDEISYLGRK